MPFASGSPKFAALRFGTFRSGGPSNDGSMASLGSGFWIFTWGGVNCVHWNLGNLPLLTGVRVWSFAPPPPPAFLAPAGSFAMYGDRSIAVTSTPFLFFACAADPKCQNNGINMTSAKTLPWMAKEITWVQPKFSSFVQMSFTFTGLLVKFAGGSLVGKKTSLMREPNPPKF